MAKMLNIISHQGNENQDHTEVSLHTGQNGYHQKPTNNNAGEDVEKREHVRTLQTVGGNVN